jgi:hypothetical protein
MLLFVHVVAELPELLRVSDEHIEARWVAEPELAGLPMNRTHRKAVAQLFQKPGNQEVAR